MRKGMWLGLTTAIGALVIAGTTVLVQDRMQARIPTPTPGDSKVFSPPDEAEVQLPPETGAIEAREG